MSIGFLQDRRCARLCDALNLQPWGALGVMRAICDVAAADLAVSEEGIFTGWAPEDIARAIGWTATEAKTLLDAIVAAGLARYADDGSFSIHNWCEWQPQFVRERNHKRRYRQAQRSGAESHAAARSRAAVQITPDDGPPASEKCPRTVPGQSQDSHGTATAAPEPPPYNPPIDVVGPNTPSGETLCGSPGTSVAASQDCPGTFSISPPPKNPPYVYTATSTNNTPPTPPNGNTCNSLIPGLEPQVTARPKIRDKTKQIRIPPALNNPEFRTAWSEWLAYRAERRNKVTDRAAELQLRKLAAAADQAVAMIRQSIENGWSGLFPVRKEKPYAAATNRSDRETAMEQRAKEAEAERHRARLEWLARNTKRAAL